MRSGLHNSLIAGTMLVGGCAGLSESPQPLVPSQFVRSRAAVGPNPIGEPVGQSGALAYGELHSPLLPDEELSQNPRPAPGVSPLVQRDVPAPGEGVGARPGIPPTPLATAPATLPTAGDATGYQVVGTVVATVNTKPIFADQVLARLDHELAAEAHKYDRQGFSMAAQKDIWLDVERRINDQLEIEQANTALSQDAKNQADLIAQLWRRQQITLAGGSEIIARQRAIEAGQSFDQQVRDEYERALVQLYYQQHLAPRIHVTPADMYRYYNEHKESEYTKHAEARYRLIRVDFDRSGGPEQANLKAKRIIADLKAGTISFEDEARKYNDDPSLMRTGGDMGWMQKDSYKYDRVEQAVWALQPGQFTEQPIEVSDPTSGNAFYIGQLVDKRGGNVQPFDNPDVQNAISRKLSSQQFGELRMKDLERMRNDAAIFREPNGLDITLQMAMQRYPVWVSAK